MLKYDPNVRIYWDKLFQHSLWNKVKNEYNVQMLNPISVHDLARSKQLD